MACLYGQGIQLARLQSIEYKVIYAWHSARPVPRHRPAPRQPRGRTYPVQQAGLRSWDAPLNPAEYTDAIAARWHTLYGPSRAEVPMSVLATAVMRHHLRLPGPAPERWTDVHGLLTEQTRVWAEAAQRWPYLHHRWEQYLEWPQWPDADRTRAAARTFALDLITMGVIEHLSELTYNVDFLGSVLHRLRAPLSTAPGPLAPRSNDPWFRESVLDSTVYRLDRAGTGAGRVLTRVKILRDAGLSPAERSWYLREIDEFSAAVLAVNLACWQVADPGRPNVVVSTSEDTDWVKAEREEQAASSAALGINVDRFPALGAFWP